MRRLILAALWLGFVGYAFGLAPPDQPDTATLILHLSNRQWDGINPWVIALFNVMGVWPVIYAAVVLADGREQSFPAWPFVVGSFALGAFALLPYLVLRQSAPQTAPQSTSQTKGEPSRLLKVNQSRWVGWGCAIASLVLLIYGFTQGDWGDFVLQWQSSRFIHVMGLDFCLLCLLFPVLLKDDMARRQRQDTALFWAVTATPLLGPALYLALRPPMTAPMASETPAVST